MLRTETNKTLKNIFKCFLRNQKKKSDSIKNGYAKAISQSRLFDNGFFYIFKYLKKYIP